jgi:antitoxin CptB
VNDDERIKRLKFRSWHRGTREMDLLLGSFADIQLSAFSAPELDQYERILGLGDPDLYNWITGAEPVPPQHEGPVMRRLCEHQFQGKKAV